MKPDPETCRIWQVQLTSSAVETLPLHLLHADELARAARLRHPRDRERFTGCRAALRAVLGQCLQRSPTEITLTYGAHGKPELAREEGLYFNVSHSGDLGLIAVARHAPLGVDVEEEREIKNALRLADRYFTRNEYGLVAAADAAQRSTIFLRCWTRKEALLKSAGHGLTRDPRTVEICGAQVSADVELEWPLQSGTRMSVRSLEVRAGFIAACAVCDRIKRIELLPFDLAD